MPKKCLHIQLQPRLCDGDAENRVNELIAIATGSDPDAVVRVERGEDDGPYINVNIDTTELIVLWSNVSSQIESSPSLASATIVCCEGAGGWDDFRLLHHFDENETVDTLI